MPPATHPALPCAGVTAWNAVVEQGQIRAGDRILIQGTGGVALFALQFAKMHGAETIVTSSSEQKLERVRELGPMVTRNNRLQGITVGDRDMFCNMVQAMALHQTRPVIHDTGFAFDEIGAALGSMSKGRNFGKLVCEL